MKIHNKKSFTSNCGMTMIILGLICLAGCGGGGGGGIASSSFNGKGTVTGYLYTPVAARAASATAAGHMPLSGASVTCSGVSDITDAAGYYELEKVPAGSQSCTATKTGYGTIRFSVSVVPNKTVIATPEGSTDYAVAPEMSGVLAVTSTPSTGAMIIIDGSTSAVTTDASLTLAPGSHSVLVSHADYEAAAAQNVLVVANATATLSFSLTIKTSSISISPGSATLAPGATQQFSAECVYADDTTADCTSSLAWSSSDSGVAAISSAALLNAVAPGTAVVTAARSQSGVSATASVSVTCPDGQAWHQGSCQTDSLTSITVTPATVSLDVGETQSLTAACVWNVSGSAPCPVLTWTSTNTGVATVSSQGVVTAAGAGSATVKAGASGVDSNSVSVTATVSVCGDSIVTGSEQCDDGNTATEVCVYGQMSCTVCNATCQSVAGATSYCGDSIVNGSEQCDDGNTASGDGCSSVCATEAQAISAPSGLASENNGYSLLRLSWNAVSGAAGYNVFIDDVKDNQELITGTSYTAGDKQAGGNYAVRVQAVDLFGGESQLSSAAAATTFALSGDSGVVSGRVLKPVDGGAARIAGRTASRVTQEGYEVASGVALTLRGTAYETTTDEWGWYEVAALPAGSYDVQALYDGGTPDDDTDDLIATLADVPVTAGTLTTLDDLILAVGIYSGVLTDVDVGPGNTFYVLSSAGVVKKFLADGGFVKEWGEYGSGDGQFNMPMSIAVSPDGYVYVSDSINERIQKFTADGEYVSQWGSWGTGNGQFRAPEGIAVDSQGFVYVGDAVNYRIQKFTADGTYVTQWGSLGTGDGQFGEDQGTIHLPAIAVDGSDNVYVLDWGNTRVQKFTSDGTFITKWGSVGSGDGQFYSPYSIAADIFGNVYVGGVSNGRIQKFDSSGVFIASYGTEGSGEGQFGNVVGLSVDASENIYAVDMDNKRAVKFSFAGGWEYEISQWGEPDVAGPGEFNQPEDLVVDASGNVYVADSFNFRIQKFDPNGEYMTMWGMLGTGDGQFQNILGIDIDADGNIMATDMIGFRVQKFTPDGLFLEAISLGQYIQNLAIDSSGNYWVTVPGISKVIKYDSSGNWLLEFGSEGTADGQFDEIHGIAIDAADNVYVTSGKPNSSGPTPPTSTTARIQKFDSSGNFILKWGTTFGWDGNGTFLKPFGVAVDDATGRIYVSDTQNHYVQIFTSTGTFLGQWGGMGEEIGQFMLPRGIYIDGAGNVYVADSSNHRYQVFQKAYIDALLQ